MKLIKKVIKAFKWLRIIWNDEDWDYTYLYIILRFKISLMVESFEKYGNKETTEIEIKQMKEAISILDIIIGDKRREDILMPLYDYDFEKSNGVLPKINVSNEDYSKALSALAEKEDEDLKKLFELLKNQWWY